MNTDYDPAATIPAIPDEIEQGLVRSWSREEGQTLNTEYKGKYSVLESVYDAYVQLALDGAPDIASLDLRVINGRASLTVRRADQQYGEPGEGTKFNVGVDQLYPIDITKDVAAAPRYNDLEATMIVAVKKSITEGEDIESAQLTWNETVDPTVPELNMMNELYKRYAHGENTYLETAYIFRRTYITSSQLRAITLLGTVNTVITQAALLAVLNDQVSAIIEELPAGEWLVRTPEVEFIGKGKYHISEEYQWAEQWSDLYTGGTLTYS